MTKNVSTVNLFMKREKYIVKHAVHNHLWNPVSRPLQPYVFVSSENLSKCSNPSAFIFSRSSVLCDFKRLAWKLKSKSTWIITAHVLRGNNSPEIINYLNFPPQLLSSWFFINLSKWRSLMFYHTYHCQPFQSLLCLLASRYLHTDNTIEFMEMPSLRKLLTNV